jgi:hypothetical protein
VPSASAVAVHYHGAALDPRHETGRGAPDLGHVNRDLALGGLDPPWPRAVPGARCIGRPLVAGTPEEGRHLVLDGPLEDQLGAEAPELTQLVGAADPTEQHLLDGIRDPCARGYSSFHGVGLRGNLPSQFRAR